jgi:hypothetical protein
MGPTFKPVSGNLMLELHHYVLQMSCTVILVEINQMSQRILVCSASNLPHMQVKVEHKPFTLLIHTKTPRQVGISGICNYGMWMPSCQIQLSSSRLEISYSLVNMKRCSILLKWTEFVLHDAKIMYLPIEERRAALWMCGGAQCCWKASGLSSKSGALPAGLNIWTYAGMYLLLLLLC